MIELTFNSFFMLYLSLTLAVILSLWLYSHYRKRRQLFFQTEKELQICEYCHFAYLVESTQELNRCPQCSLFNRKQKSDE